VAFELLAKFGVEPEHLLHSYGAWERLSSCMARNWNQASIRLI